MISAQPSKRKSGTPEALRLAHIVVQSLLVCTTITICYIYYIYTYIHTVEYYLATKKETLPFAIEIDFEGIVLSE